MPKKKTARRKAAKSKKATKRERAKIAKRGQKAGPRRKIGAGARTRRTRSTSRVQGETGSIRFRSSEAESESGGQSGDIEGLPRVARADSESVEELEEEGQAFEADVVAGVEQAEDEEEKEVKTREVPEDDVPSEYDDDR